MKDWTLHCLAQHTAGILHGQDHSVCGVSTDTRTLKPGELFVALRGEHFDGHQFLNKAQAMGAAGALVDASQPSALPQIQVPNTLIALQQLGTTWRQAFAGPVIAVTGSNGKTTVKEMIAALLRGLGPVLSTQGNLNNDIGVPLTLTRLGSEHFAVVEMGANHPGEIGRLSQMTQPDVALINNAGRAHLEGFGDLQGVRRAKGEIVAGLKATGWLVLNRDDPGFADWQASWKREQILSFGEHPAADVRLIARPDQPAEVVARGQHWHVSLQHPGRHNQCNAVAALAVALALGLDAPKLSAALSQLPPVHGRLEDIPNALGIRLIDDTYNANPDSVLAALDWLGGLPGRRWLVLGNLGELGPDAQSLHQEIGTRARASGIHHLYAVGELAGAAAQAFGEGGMAFNDQSGLLTALRQALQPGDQVLIKGSRRASMDQVVQQLTVQEV